MTKEARVRRDVVITGMGCVSPLGNDLATTWRAAREGRSGIGPVTRFDASPLTTRFAGEVKDFDPHTILDRKTARHMDRFQHLAAAAAFEALAHSRFQITSDNAERVGVIVGSGIGGIETLTQQIPIMDERGPMRVAPFLIT